MRYFFILISFLVFHFSIFAFQPDSTILKCPELLEVEVNAVASFKLDLHAADSLLQFEVVWRNLPEGAEVDARTNYFKWIPTANDIGLHKIFLMLLDSTGTVLERCQTLIKVVNVRENAPIITFNPDSLMQQGVIKLLQGKAYELKFFVDTERFKEEQFVFSYVLNNSPGLRKFANSSFELQKNGMVVNWTPNHRQAEKKDFLLELVVISEQNAVKRQNFYFEIIDRNLPPKQKFELRDSYLVTPNQTLEIDFGVTDPDNDSIAYTVEVPVSIGNPTISAEGRFSWTLTGKEYARISSIFPLIITLRAEEIGNSEHVLERQTTIYRSGENDPPKITRLSNLSIMEGYALKNRIFIEDKNNELSDMEFFLENGPDWLYLSQEGEALYLMADTISFNEVRADGIPVIYDVLFTVQDPDEATDSKFFSMTVKEGINTVKVYREFTDYTHQSDLIIKGLQNKIKELDSRLQKSRRLKKSFLYASFALGTFSASGAFFDDNTLASQMVPYAGALLAVTSSINALAFNKEDKMASLKSRLENIEKDFVKNKSYLGILTIVDDHDDQLRNPQLVTKLQQYRQSLIEQRIEIEKLEDSYMELPYVQRKIRKNRRKGIYGSADWNFLK